jgi:hypothetical protein
MLETARLSCFGSMVTSAKARQLARVLFELKQGPGQAGVDIPPP